MATKNNTTAAATASIEALVAARKNYVDGVGAVEGTRLAYIDALCTRFGNDWVEALASKSDNAKPLQAEVEIERKALMADLKAKNYGGKDGNGAHMYWKRVKDGVALYVAEKKLEAAKVAAEGKSAKTAASKRAAEAAEVVKKLQAAKRTARQPGGQPASGEAPKEGAAPKGKDKGAAGITLVSANAFIMAQLALASENKGTPFTPPLRRGLANLAEAIAAYFTANPMDKLEAAIAAKK